MLTTLPQYIRNNYFELGTSIRCIDGDIICENYNINNLQNEFIFKKIREFGKLELGWRYGEGVPALENVMSAAINLYSELSFSADYFRNIKTNAFPNADGGITLSFGFNDDFIELVINPDLKMDLTHEKGFGSNYDIVEELYDLEINNSIVLTYLYRICNLLEQSILSTTTKTKEDLIATYSKIIKEEYPSLKKNVPKALATTQSVITYQISIQKQPVAL